MLSPAQGVLLVEAPTTKVREGFTQVCWFRTGVCYPLPNANWLALQAPQRERESHGAPTPRKAWSWL